MTRQKGLATVLVLLMVALPFSLTVDAYNTPWEGQTHPRPSFPGGATNISTTGFTLPANGTITDGWLDISTDWDQPGGNGSGWAANGADNFTTGQHYMTSATRFDGALSLDQEQSVGSREDFENLETTLLDWNPQGPEALIWAPTDLNISGTNVTVSGDLGIFNSTFAGTIPAAPTEGNLVISTLGTPHSRVPTGAHAWLEGPAIDLPNVIRNYTMSIDYWIHLDNGGGWVDYSLDGGQWKTLNPIGNYTTQLSQSSPQPFGFANATASGWKDATFELDDLSGIHSANQIRFRLVLWTDANISLTGPGWFVDNLTLENQGEPLACWFHGNLNGVYADNADAWIELEFSTTNLTTPLEIKASLDWDLEGGFNDNLVVEVSNDNATWYEISLHPGIPGVGIVLNGIPYTDETGGWVDVIMPLPTIMQNRSNIWLRFRVETDYALGYGASINGWEGVMVDDVVLHANSSLGRVAITLDNFSTNDSVTIGNTPGKNEQWQHLTNYGHNGPSQVTYGFESIIDLPRGWHLNHVRGDKWQFGQTNNGSGWGPGSFPGQGHGTGMNLQGKYGANTLTHLETKDWLVPYNSSAFLVFDHWVCTELNWDGGLISISNDHGLTWSPFAQQQQNFYDAVSTANPFSPLYNLSIFDGSSQTGGCNVQPWDSKRANLSAWAGDSVRFRFTFFSDSYVEGAGWYIDNVGVEVDLFESSGKWTSPQIMADAVGYGTVTIGGEIPQGTIVLATVLDSTWTPIVGYNERSLPLNLRGISPFTHSSIYLRMELSTADTYRTPIIQQIHVGDNHYLTFPNLENSGWDSQNGNPVTWDYGANGYVPVNGTGSMTSNIFLHRPARSLSIYCDCNSVYLSVAPVDSPTTAYISKQIVSPSTNHLNGLYLRDLQGLRIEISILPNGLVSDFRVDVEYSDIAINPIIDLKGDGISEWEHSGAFGVETDIDGGYDEQFYLLSGVTVTKNLGYHNFSQVYDGIVRISIVAPSSTTTTISIGSETMYATGSHFSLPYPLRAIVSGQQTQISFTSDDDASITIHEKVVPYANTFRHDLEQTFLENISAGLDINQSTGEFAVPVNLTTDRGGFIVDGEIEWDTLFQNSYTILPPGTIYPDGSSFVVETLSQHNFAGLIDTVRLSIGSSRDVANAEVVYVVENASTSLATLKVVRGSEMMAIDTVDFNYGSDESNRKIRWNLTPSRAWGDQSQLWWMVESSNSQSSPLGPLVISTGGAAGPAVEVDLEVTNIVAIDRFGNDIADRSDAHYPFTIAAESEVSLSGFVRFQGSPDIPPPASMFNLNLSLIGSADGNIFGQTQAEYNAGNWLANLSLPSENQADSGSVMRIVPSLEFNDDEISNGVSDETLDVIFPHLIFDSQGPRLGELFVVPTGMRQPADSHIWYTDNALALSVEVSDDVRNGEALNLHYWVQGQDDANNDGLADADEYRILSEQLSQNILNQTVDFPLISMVGAIPSGHDAGLVSLWLDGTDLAGNLLQSGGTSGMVNDLATLTVVADTPSEVSTSSLSLDLIDGKLLAGHRHNFVAVITDAEGITSLDAVIFDLTGDIDGDFCAIEWHPWSGDLYYAEDCFVAGQVNLEQVHLVQEGWRFEISFILPWQNESVFGHTTWTPSLSLIDLGQDLGVGLSSITPLSWTYNGEAELVVVELVDQTQPIGGLVEDTIYLSSDDNLSIGVILVHAGTEIALDIGFGFQIRAEGGINQTNASGWYAGDGEAGYASMQITYDDYPNLRATLHIEPSPLGGQNEGVPHINGITYYIVFDNYAPRLYTHPNLNSVHIDRMEYIPLTFDLIEADAMATDSVYVHVAFLSPLNETRYVVSSPAIFTSQSEADWNYHVILNLTPPANLQWPMAGDKIHLWIEGYDMAGNKLNGGSMYEPILRPAFIAPRFLPQLDKINLPSQVEIGSTVRIDGVVENLGQLRANATLALYVDGEWVESQDLDLPPSVAREFNFEYIALILGDHDFVVVLNQTNDNRSSSVEVIDANWLNDAPSFSSTIGAGLAMLFIFAAIIIIVRGRTLVFDEYDEGKEFTGFSDFEEE